MNNFRIIQGFASNSASPTDILEGDFFGQNCIAKIYIDRINFSSDYGATWRIEQLGTAELLNHEADVYVFLKNKLVVDFNMRNILSLSQVYEFTFNEYLDLLINSLNLVSRGSKNLAYNSIIRNSMNMLKYLVTPLTRYRKSLTDFMSLHFARSLLPDIVSGSGGNRIQMKHNIYRCLITPKINQQTLTKYFSDNAGLFYGNQSKFMNIMFVIFATIACMAKVGVNQNDLHWGNILFDTNYFGRTRFHLRKYIIIYGNKMMLVDLPGTPIIYDFDRSVVNGIPIPRLQQYEFGGNCQQFHKNRDILRTICNMYKHVNSLFSHRAEFNNIRNHILNNVILSSTLRTSIQDMRDGSCWMQGGALSLQCIEAELNNGI
ncbi:MAG: hypothetical protein ACK518_03850, partial [bacterium]